MEKTNYTLLVLVGLLALLLGAFAFPNTEVKYYPNNTVEYVSVPVVDNSDVLAAANLTLKDDRFKDLALDLV